MFFIFMKKIKIQIYHSQLLLPSNSHEKKKKILSFSLHVLFNQNWVCPYCPVSNTFSYPLSSLVNSFVAKLIIVRAKTFIGIRNKVHHVRNRK